MLNQLLTHIQEGQGLSVEELAEELGTSPSMVTAMLGTLTRQGYLGKIEQTCSEACETCPLAKQCKVASKTTPQIWMLNTQ